MHTVQETQGGYTEVLPQEKSRHRNVGNIDRLLSLVGGGALVAYGVKSHSLKRIALLSAAGYLLYRSKTGRCAVYDRLGIDTAHGKEHGVHIEKNITINRPVEEVYRFWRNLENLPRFMEHLESVKVLDERRSHWVASGPMGYTAEWDAEIIEDRPNAALRWQSLPGAEVQNEGRVTFRTAPHGRGTELRVVLNYNPPFGAAGEAFAKLLNVVTSQQLEEELRNFKHLMEAGEIPTTEGQPTGSH